MPQVDKQARVRFKAYGDEWPIFRCEKVYLTTRWFGNCLAGITEICLGTTRSGRLVGAYRPAEVAAKRGIERPEVV
jgi:hypothetical protein